MERHSLCYVTAEWNQYESEPLGWSSRDLVELSQTKGISIRLKLDKYGHEEELES